MDEITMAIDYVNEHDCLMRDDEGFYYLKDENVPEYVRDYVEFKNERLQENIAFEQDWGEPIFDED